MSGPDYDRVGSVIAQVLARMVPTHHGRPPSAARLGIELLRTDDELLRAIRLHLAGKAMRAGGASAQPSRHGTLATLRKQRDKLLQTYLADQISADYFAEQEKALTAKINAMEAECSEAVEAERKSNALVAAFEQAMALLRDPALEFEAIWDAANDAERRVLVEELIEAVTITLTGWRSPSPGLPRCSSTSQRLGCGTLGTGPVVSEDRPEPPRCRAGWVRSHRTWSNW